MENGNGEVKYRAKDGKEFKCGEYEIDLGCGNACDRSMIGIDIDPHSQAQIVRDIDRAGLPFCRDSCKYIKAYSVMEHLNNFLFVMNGCRRVLKEGGILDIRVPRAGSNGSFRDPTHKRLFTKNTFDYFTENKPKYYSMYDEYGFIVKKWKIISCEQNKDNGTISVKMSPIK